MRGLGVELLTAAQVAQLEEVVLAQPQETIVGDIVTGRDESIWATDPIDVPVLIINAKSPNWTDEYRAFVDELTIRSSSAGTWALSSAGAVGGP